jgi:hypothetical protein
VTFSDGSSPPDCDQYNPGQDGQPCTVGEESGVTCPTVERCSTGELVEGCCILGTCN